MKKVIALASALLALSVLFWKFGHYYSADARDEIRMTAVPTLDSYADKLWFTIKSEKRLSEKDLIDKPDPWGQQIRAEILGDVLKLTSAGPDREFDTEDDIKIERTIK